MIKLFKKPTVIVLNLKRCNYYLDDIIADFDVDSFLLIYGEFLPTGNNPTTLINEKCFRAR